MKNDFVDFSDLDDLDSAPIKSVSSVEESISDWAERGSVSAQGAIYEEPCKDCNGSGNFVSWSGRVVGQCFKCNGSGIRKFKSSPEQRQKNRERAAKKRSDKIMSAAKAGMEWIDAHPEENKFLLDNASWSDFYRELSEQVIRRGGLSEKQLAAVQRGMEKAKARAEEKAKELADRPVLDKLVASFKHVVENGGMKKPKLVFGELVVSLAPANGKNAGHLYVKWQDWYMGKISPEGAMLILARCPAEARDKLVELNVDRDELVEKAKLEGKESGVCCMCGAELSDPVSVANGIGPICEGRWG